MSVGKKIVTGAAVLTSMRFAIRFIGLLSTLVLARVLVPEDFGLVGLAISYLAIIEGVAALNLNSALIRIRDEERGLYDTAWTLGLLRGVLVALIVCTSALFMPKIMDEPRLEALIYIIASVPLMQGLKNPQFIQFEKQLNYKPLFIASIVAKIVSAVVTVTLAIIYQTYWALIIGTLLSNVIEVGMSYILKPYMPRASFSRIRDIFGFTAWLSLASILSTLNLKLDSLIIGGFLNTKFVGYYRIGDELTSLPTSEMIAPLTRTFFPAFAEMSADIAKLRHNALEASSVVAAISLPATFGFAFLAEDVVRLLVGEQWLAAVPMIQILTPVIGMQMMASVGNSLCLATGRTSLIFRAEAAYFLIRAVLVLTGIIYWGFIGIIVARGIAGLTRVAINFSIMRATVKSRFLDPVVHAWRSIVSSVIMIAALWVLDTIMLTDAGSWHSAYRTLLYAPLGAAIYVALHWVLWILQNKPVGAETRFLTTIRQYRNKA